MTRQQSELVLEAVTDAVLSALPGQMLLSQKLALAAEIRREAARVIAIHDIHLPEAA